MSRELNPSQIWSQLPVASRTVEVNTKTGFSLTAGSYSVRASSTQYGNLDIQYPAFTGTLTISSVTKTRSISSFCGQSTNDTTVNNASSYILLTNATTVTGGRGANANQSYIGVSVLELF